MLLIYSQYDSPRFRYTCEVLLHDLSGIRISFTNDVLEFTQYEGAKINYSPGTLSEKEIRIEPHSLLFETGIRPLDVTVEKGESYPLLFPTPGGDLLFDIFAASFYLLSRYEEYLPYQPDEYGRFPHAESLAFRNGFLRLPVINYWLTDFLVQLQTKFPTLVIESPQFTFIPTYDIDMAFSYLHKGIKRNAGGLMRSFIRNEMPEIKERVAVLAGKQEDPFNAFEWLHALHENNNLRPYYFFLVAASRGRYDKNINPNHPVMQKLISRQASAYSVGIHPSWQSGDNPALLSPEIQTLQTITGKEIINSRQHYIRFQLPETYRRLIDHGITHEFSMGYATINGFRASVTSPYYWYDLHREEKTNLLIYPFCFMDANAYYKQKLSPSQAYDEIQYFYHAIRKINGTMITIWHNSFLGSGKKFRGWKEVYESFIKGIAQGDR